MDKTAQAVELLRELVKPKDVYFFATVKKITGDTCTVIIQELELPDVRMKATDNKEEEKLLVIPSIGSMVIVGANGGDFRSVFLIKVDNPQKILYKHKDTSIEIDGENGEIKFNGGNLGGLIKIQKLVDKVNTIENDINTLKQCFSSWTPVAQDGGAALKAQTANWATQQLQNTEVGDIENEKITHG